MSAAALGLVCLAAIVHAGWNLLVKQVRDDGELITWLALAVGSVLLALALAGRSVFIGSSLIGAWHSLMPVWPYVVGSAAAEGVYVVLLTAAYRHGDLSVVYPIARGTAPLLLAGWAALFLSQLPRLGGLLGIGALALGVIMVAGSADPRPVVGSSPLASGSPAGRPAPGRWGDVALALGVALCISTYSVIDGWAVQRASAAAYEAAVFGLAAVLTAPLILNRMPWATALGVCRRRWRRVVVVGGAMAGGYLLVLWAFRLAPIAYVGATREVSIVVAALAGWRVLGERLSVTRLLGAVVIVLGIAAIKWFG